MDEVLSALYAGISFAIVADVAPLAASKCIFTRVGVPCGGWGKDFCVCFCLEHLSPLLLARRGCACTGYKLLLAGPRIFFFFCVCGEKLLRWNVTLPQTVDYNIIWIRLSCLVFSEHLANFVFSERFAQSSRSPTTLRSCIVRGPTHSVVKIALSQFQLTIVRLPHYMGPDGPFRQQHIHATKGDLGLGLL